MRPSLLTLTSVLTLLALVGCADGRRSGYGAPPPSSAPDAAWRSPDAGVGGGSDDAELASPDAAMPSGGEVDASLGRTEPTETVLPGVPALRCGRTYDHEGAYLLRGGEPDFASMRHRDGTALPADEGGVACGGRTGCEESVTLLCDGDSLTGALVHASGFSVQGAQSGEPGTGSLSITVCGREVPATSFASTSSTLPGFVNFPQPAAPVPTLERCEVTVRATGGCVWVRAVTVTCPEGTPYQPPG